MMNIIIRKAALKDINSLTALLEGLFSIETDFIFNKKKQEKALRLLINNTNDKIILVACDGDTLVGMLSGQIVVSTASGGFSVLLEDLFVQKDYRGLGIGSMLLLKITEWGHEMDCVRIQLVADKTNSQAKKFYLKHGFSATRMSGFYIPI
jgi:ribosomal protein S18 acetylase RimI-like enzyme